MIETDRRLRRMHVANAEAEDSCALDDKGVARKQRPNVRGNRLIGRHADHKRKPQGGVQLVARKLATAAPRHRT